MTTITAVLPCFNASATLERAICSIESQNISPFRVLAVDDGSTDTTLVQLRAWASRNDAVEVVARPHSGLVDTLRYALGLVDTTYVARFDADDHSDSRRLSEQIYALETRRADLVASDCLITTTDDPDIRCRVLTPSTDSLWPATLAARNPIAHGGVTYRTDAVVAAGGYDPEESYVEDIGLWLRMITTGAAFTAVHLPLSTIYLSKESTSARFGRQSQRRRTAALRRAWLQSPRARAAVRSAIRTQINRSSCRERADQDDLDRLVAAARSHSSSRPTIGALRALLATRHRRSIFSRYS